MGASNADYERQFKEIVAKAKAVYGTGAYDDSTLEFLIPGLRESEDERTRKEIIEFIRSQIEDGNSVGWDRWIAYLEKQKEQKPAEYLSKDKVYAIMNKLTELSTSELIPLESEEYVKIHEITSDVCSLLDYPIEPKQEWSEEDEKLRRNLMSLLANMRGDRITEETYQKYYPWLKSLRPSWKPSEEQMMDEWLKDRDGCFWDGVEEGKKAMKDALMEWAKGRREAVAKEVVIQEGVRLGADAAFEELIDKLNEM